MSTYNEPMEYIKQSIISILDQSYADIELIVGIDNPKRSDIIDYIKTIAKTDTRIRYVINKKNLGLTKTLNKLVNEANGQYIARMDADDISLAHRLQEQLDFLKKNDLDITGCYIHDIDENGNTRSSKATKYPTKDHAIKEYLKYDSAIPHPTWLAKSSVFKENKYIDYDACEDYELLTRLSLKKYKMGNLSRVGLYYRINNKGISRSKTIEQRLSKIFIRDNYRKKKISNYTNYQNFKNSKKGIEAHRELEKFYEERKRISKLPYVTKIAASVKLLTKSDFARQLVINEIRKRFLINE